MSESRQRIVAAFCEVLNKVKRTGFTAQQLREDTYLGGELGIDSVEMLEIWYDLEKQLSVYISDEEKRNIFTLREVVDLIERKL